MNYIVRGAQLVLFGLPIALLPSFIHAAGFSYEVSAGLGSVSDDCDQFDPALGDLEDVIVAGLMEFTLSAGMVFEQSIGAVDLTLSFNGMIETPAGNVPVEFEGMTSVFNVTAGIAEYFDVYFSEIVEPTSMPPTGFVGTGTFPLTASWDTSVQFQWSPAVPGNVIYVGGSANGNISASYQFTPAPTDHLWDNAAGGGFSTSANWVSDTVPGPTHTARIELGGDYTVTLSEDVETDRLIIGNGSGHANPTLDLGSHTYTTSLTNVGNMGHLNLDGTHPDALLKTDTLLIDPGGEMSGSGWVRAKSDGGGTTTFENMGALSLGLSSESSPTRTQFTNTDGGPEPDEFYAHMVVRGEYTQDPSATTNIVLNASKAANQSQSPEAGPPPPRSADMLVTGNVGLGGTLNVDFADGYQPQHGESFTLVETTSGTIFSPFGTANLPVVSDNGLPLEVVYGPKTLSAVVPQKVVLAWGHDLPVGMDEVSIFGQTIFCENPLGSEDAFTVTGSEEDVAAFSIYQSALLQRVQQHYDMSGIDGVVFTAGDPEPNATNIYFIDPAASDLDGYAVSDIDRMNMDPEGVAAVFVNGFNPNDPFNVEFDSETVAHELGHLLGLRHIDPPGDVSIMDYDTTPGDFELFQDGVYNIWEPPGDAPPQGEIFPDTHNPVYHLSRYVDGIPHEDLVAAGVLPGTWDLPGDVFEDLDNSFSFSLPSSMPAAEGASPAGTSPLDMTLYDVVILRMQGDPSTPDTLATFAEITLADLAQQSFRVTEGEGIGILAASIQGGARDIALAEGDPFAPNALVMYPGLDQLQGFLQIESGSPAGYDTLVDVTIQVTIVPEVIPGDGNGDGWVDGLDYLLWAANYGGHPGADGDISDGDYNDDGWIDGLDYLLWGGQLRQSCRYRRAGARGIGDSHHWPFRLFGLCKAPTNQRLSTPPHSSCVDSSCGITDQGSTRCDAE